MPNITQVGAYLGVAATVVGLGTAGWKLLSRVYSVGEQLGELKLKVDLIWEFLMRRALAEGLTKGVLEQHSPLTISTQLRAVLQEKFPDLPDWFLGFHRDHPDISDNDFYLAVEKLFGDRILKDMCIPLGLTNGACLVGIGLYCQEMIPVAV